MKTVIITLTRFFYTKVIKPLLFLHDPFFVHGRIVRIGQLLGRVAFTRVILSYCFGFREPVLSQTLFGIEFKGPMGLAAGFDYEARLTGILPTLGFAFGTVGTLTNRPYGGNPKPTLGRLPKSKSLMVNKGFRNDSVKVTLRRLAREKFAYPVGVSIGTSNDGSVKTETEAVYDIVESFKTAESSGVAFAYYELNISCPNLSIAIDFYNPSNLEILLDALGKLNLTRPVFIKMPITETDEEVVAMMEVIVQHAFVKAVILGNLQSNRNHPALIREEVDKFSVGNFSGLPCRDRSDELIRLVYRRFGSQIKIIGCGGVFCADDAYRKIALGASLVELITGLIFEGPQLVAQINRDIAKRLKKEGYKSMSQLVGTGA